MATIEQRFQDAEKLLEKADFLEKLKGINSDEECQKLFADNGVELSLEDIKNMVKASAAAAKDGDLSEEDLENVSGGIILTTIGCFTLGTTALGFFTSYGVRAFSKYF